MIARSISPIGFNLYYRSLIVRQIFRSEHAVISIKIQFRLSSDVHFSKISTCLLPRVYDATQTMLKRSTPLDFLLGDVKCLIAFSSMQMHLTINPHLVQWVLASEWLLMLWRSEMWITLMRQRHLLIKYDWHIVHMQITWRPSQEEKCCIVLPFLWPYQ